MTIVLENYMSRSGYHAEICIEKDSKLYTLIISKPIHDNPGFAMTVFKREYMTIYNARKALRKQGEYIRIEGGKLT